MSEEQDYGRGHRGNSNLKKPNVKIDWTKEQVEEFIKCQDDPIYFAEKYIKIITSDDGLVTLKLFDYQKEMIESMHNNKKTIIATSRRAGKSTAVCAYILWFVIFNGKKTVGILSDKAETSVELLGKIQLAYQYLPKWLQHGILEFHKKSFLLENHSRVLASATSKNSLRGFNIDILFVDECAHISQFPEFYQSVYPTISSGLNSKLILVSTPLGLNHYYFFWDNAIKGLNGFHPIEITWERVPTFNRNPKFKEETLAALNFDLQKFQQEYEVAWLGSSGTLISGSKLAQLSAAIPLVDKLDSKQYEKPIKDHKYITICDVSRGKGLDYSAFSVIDVTQLPFKQIFTYRDNMVTPLDYAEIIYRVSKSYNNSYALIEINDIGQQVADSLFNDFDYENIIYTQSKGRAGKVADLSTTKTSDRGIRTTKTVKSVGCSILKMLIEQDKLLIPDKETIFELSTFSRKNDSYEAEPGKHDDLVIGLVLFAWLSDQQLFTDLNNISTLNVLKQKTEEDYNNEMLNFFIDSGEELEEIIQEKGNWLFPLELELVSGEYEEQINIYPNQIGNEYKYN